jgi:hypothetical protein
VDETARRRLSISRELMTCAYITPRLIRRIDDGLCLPNVTPVRTIEVESIGQRIGVLLKSIHAAVEADHSYEQLSASLDRLREEIAAADLTLNQLLGTGRRCEKGQ